MNWANTSKIYCIWFVNKISHNIISIKDISTAQCSIYAGQIFQNSLIFFKCILQGLSGDSRLEVGEEKLPSLRILQFIHTLQQEGPFIHTDPPSLCEWRAQCSKVRQLFFFFFLSQNQRMCCYFSLLCSDQVSMRRRGQNVSANWERHRGTKRRGMQVLWHHESEAMTTLCCLGKPNQTFFSLSNLSLHCPGVENKMTDLFTQPLRWFDFFELGCTHQQPLQQPLMCIL